MRSNRKRKRRDSTVYGRVIWSVSVCILILAFGAISRLTLKSRCASLGSDLRKLEKEALALRDDITREQSDWAELTKPERLEIALSGHGIHMETRHVDKQIVSMQGIKPFSDVSGEFASMAYAQTR